MGIDHDINTCFLSNAYLRYVFLISEHFPCGIGISARLLIVIVLYEIFWMYSILIKNERYGRRKLSYRVSCPHSSSRLPVPSRTLPFAM